jgi:hypothetical protein
MKLKTLALTAAAVVALAGAAQAETVKYTAQLKGSDEVPANTEKGTGTVNATYDTTSKMFHYDVTYAGLTGPATAAHFHGPAAPGANAPPVVPVNPPVASPISGMATLTDAQAADLAAGKWYFNVHTDAHKGGEIRGQVMKAQ